MKFNEIKKTKSLSVHGMTTNPFEGVYIGKVPGEYGDNYKFESNGQEFVVLSTKDLRQKMALVKPGYAVRITKIGESPTRTGGTYIEVRVEVGSQPAPGYESGDLS